MVRKKKHRMLTWLLTAIACFLFLELLAKYGLYHYHLYKSYKLTKNYYEVKKGYWEFKKRYEATQAIQLTPDPIVHDIYNRKYYPPDVTGHDYGFLQNVPEAEPPEGATRILCVGTSTVQHGYPEPLQEELDAMCPGKFEVIDAGIPGAPLLSTFMNYSLIWRLLHPDIVIIEHNIDEVVSSVLLPYAMSRDLDIRNFKAHIMKPEGSYSCFGGALYKLLTGMLEYILEKKERFDNPVQDCLLRFRTLLESLVLMVRASGAQPVLLTYQPALSDNDSRGEFSPEFYSETVAHYEGHFFRLTLEGAMKTIDAHNGITREVAEEYGATLVDTVGHIPRKDEYYRDGTHQDEKAHWIVAGLIASRLTEDGTISE